MKKVLFFCLATFYVNAILGQCDQATPINLNATYQNFTEGWYVFTPSSNGRLELCPLAVFYEFYSDCNNGTPASPLTLMNNTFQLCGSCGGQDNSTQFINVTAGNSIYIFFEFPFGDPCGDGGELRFIQQGDDCNDPAPIACDETIIFNATSQTNEFGFQDLSSCGGGVLNTIGSDRVFELNIPTPEDVTITMSSTKADRDFLGVYQSCEDCFSGCILLGCVDFSQTNSSQEQITIPNAQGTYLIIADWQPIDNADAQSGNVFTVSVACGDPCDQVETLECGITTSSTTIGETSNFNSNSYNGCYFGNATFSGPDKIFEITKPSNQGNLMVNLQQPSGGDLEVFLFDICGNGFCLEGSATGSGYTYIIDADPPLMAGNYFLVVDGENNPIGFDFEITVTCGDLSCDDAPTLFCGEPRLGEDNLFAPNNTSIFNCTIGGVAAGYTGNERVYTFDLSSTEDITITLSNISTNQNFDLFLLDTCDELVCSNSSQNTGSANEVISINNLPPGTYYVIVEGYNGASGFFDIAVDWNCCADQTINNCPYLSYTYQGPAQPSGFEYCFNIDYGMDMPPVVASNWATVNGTIVEPMTSTVFQTFCYTFPTAGTYEVCYNVETDDGCVIQCCQNVEVIEITDPFSCLYGDDLINKPRRVKWFNGHVYLAATNAAPANSNSTKPTFSKYDTNGNVLWGVELDFEGNINDFEQTDDGAFLLVGRTGFGTFNNESIISKVDDMGTLLWTKTLSNPGRENIIRILKHPNPVDPLNPYYLSGVQNASNAPNQIDIALIYNIDQDGNINWKRAMNEEDDNQFVQQIIPLSSGNILMLGTVIDNAVNRGYSVELDGNGGFVEAHIASTNLTRTNAGLVLSNGDMIITGSTSGNIGGIIKVDANFTPIWTIGLNEQEGIVQVETDGQGNIYTIAPDRNANFPVITKINDLGNSAAVEWAKTLDDMVLAEARNARFDVLPTGNVVYADAREVLGYGAQEEDLFLAVLDSNLVSCSTIDVPVTETTPVVSFENRTLSSVNNDFPSETEDMAFNTWLPMQDCPCDSCTAAFTFSIGADCETVTFTNGSTGYNLTYSWDFGNGNMSTQENPVEVIALPSQVCLTVSNSDCTNTYCEQIAIQAGSFTIACPPDQNLMVDPVNCAVIPVLSDPTITGDTSCLSITVDCTRSDMMNLNDPFLPGATVITCVATDLFGSMESCSYTITVTGECCQNQTIDNCPYLSYTPQGPGQPSGFEYCFNIDYGMDTPPVVASNWATVNGTIVEPMTSMIFQNFCYTFPAAGTYEVCYNVETDIGCLIECCQMVEVIDPESSFNCLYGDEDNNVPRVVKWRNGAIYVAGDNNVGTASSTSVPTFSKYDANGNVVWAVELGTNGRIRDFEELPNGEFLLVGSNPILPSSNNSESLIAKISSSGSLVWTKLLENEGREIFDGIFIHPNPPNPGFPIYLVGRQNPDDDSPSPVDVVVLYNIDENVNINWKKIIDAVNDNQYVRDFALLHSGNYIIVGDNDTTGYFAEIDIHGDVVGAYSSEGTIDRIWSTTTLPNGEIVFAGFIDDDGAVIAKIDTNYNQIWGLRFPDQSELLQVDTDNQGTIYAIGRGSQFERPIVTKISDNGTSATIDWMKTLDDQDLVNASTAQFDVLSSGNVLYGDARDVPNFGIQNDDLFLALLDSDLTSCFTEDLPINSVVHTVSFSTRMIESVIDTVMDSTQNMVFNTWLPMQECPCDTCTAAFTFILDADCETVTFTNGSSGYNLTYSWDFGNGNMSTQENPVEVFAMGTYNVCLTVSNGDCMDMQCQIVTIEELEPPTIICPPDVTLTGDPDSCSASYVMPFPQVMDNCTDSTSLMVQSVRSDGLNLSDPWPVGTTCVTWTVTDASGNSADCQTCVTVLPVLVCPQDQFLPANDDCVAALPNLMDSIALCSAPNSNIILTQNPPPGTLLPGGCHNVTITLNDGGVPIDSCVVEVCVAEDLIPPQVVCPDTINISVMAPTTMVPVSFNVTANDNCPGVMVSCDYNSGDLFPIGCTTVTCIATDAIGLMDTCTFQVCIQQDAPCNDCGPAMGAGQNLITNGDFSAGNTGFGSQLMFGNGMILAPGQYDILNSLSVSNANPNWACLDHTTGDPNGLFFVADGNNMAGAVAWTSQSIPVIPGESYQLCFFANNLIPPSINAGGNSPDIAVNINGQQILAPIMLPKMPDDWVRFSVLWTAPSNTTMATINIYSTSIAQNGNDFALDDISFAKCEITSCLADFSWDPLQDCGLVGFLDQSVSPGTITAWNWTLNGMTISTGPSFIYDFPASGTYQVCLQIIDDQSCTDQVCQNVTVNFDDNPPTANCGPFSPVVPTDPGLCEATVPITIFPSAHSPCAKNIQDTCIRSDGQELSDPFPIGVTTITCYAIDDFGTDSCSYTITVEDEEPPELFCVNYDLMTVPGGCTASFSIPNPQATDNCPATGFLIYSGVRDDGGALDDPWPIGQTCVMWTVTDPSGNIATCEECVFVRPQVLCSATDTINVASFCEAPMPDLRDSVGVCTTPDIQVVQTPAPGTIMPQGCHIVTLEILYKLELLETCSYIFCVKDTIPPTIVCPPPYVIETDPGTCEAVFNFVPLISDNCTAVGDLIVDIERADNLPFVSPWGLGTTPVTFTVIDECDNMVSCSTAVTVEDQEDPQLFCEDILVFTAPGSCDSTVITDVFPSFSDNCDMGPLFLPTGVRDDGQLLDDPFPLGITCIDWTLTDFAGNTTTCQTCIEVVLHAESICQESKCLVGNEVEQTVRRTRYIDGDLFVCGTESIGSNSGAMLSRFDSDGTPIWTTILTTPSVFNDFVKTDDNGFMAVGATIAAASVLDNQSIITKFDASGNIIWSHTYDNCGKEELYRIIRHPNPVNAAFPYYVSGRQDELSDCNGVFADKDIFIMRVNDTGIAGFITAYDRGDDDFGKGMIPLVGSTGTGQEILLFGKTDNGDAEIQVVNGGLNPFLSRTLNFSADIYDAVEQSDGSIIIVGGRTNFGDAFIIKLSPTFNTVWSYTLSSQNYFNEIRTDGNGTFWLTGYGNIGVDRPLVNQFTDNGATATHNWTRYLDDGEQTLDPAFIDYIPGGLILYADARINTTSGLGDRDILLAVTDFQADSCLVEVDNTMAASSNVGAAQQASVTKVSGVVPPFFMVIDTEDDRIYSRDCPCCTIDVDFVFSPAQNSCTAFNFMSLSVGSGYSYNWTFPGGATSTQIDPSFDFMTSGTYQVCLQVVDSANNCEGDICKNVVVSIPTFNLTCPNDITVPTDPGLCEANDVMLIDAAAMHPPCLQLDVICTRLDGQLNTQPFPLGTTGIMCIGMDQYGNADTCFYNVIVEDLEPPTITCPVNICEFVPPMTTGANITFSDPIVSDNCSVTWNCTAQSGDFFTLGNHTVTCTAIDPAGLTAMCDFLIEVKVDSMACPANCQVNSLNISTGYDPSTSGLVPAGGSDPFWQLTQVPPNANWNVPSPAFTITPSNAWDTPGNSFFDQGWISGQPFGNYSLSNCGDPFGCAPCIPEVYQFERDFCVCTSDSVTFDFIFAGDDFIDISLFDVTNGTTTFLAGHGCDWPTPAHNNNFKVATPFNTTLFLPSGQYQLLVRLWNTDGDWMGFNIRGFLFGAGLEKDACCNPNGQITGVKYLDIDCDGERNLPNLPLTNGHDPGLANWQIELCDANGNTIATQLTGPDGRFAFQNVPPGNYMVKEVNQPGYTQSAPASGSYSISVVTNGVVSGLEFGNCLEPEDACCVNFDLFCQKVEDGFSVIRDQCNIELVANALDTCQVIAVDWGDGNSAGPLLGNTTASHTYAMSGEYDICIEIIEYDLNNMPCFTKDTCFSVCVTCDTNCENEAIVSQWEQVFQGGSWEIAADLTLDPAGNIYVVGSFEDDLTIQGQTLVAAPGGEADVFFAKLNPGGQVINNHVYQLGGDGDDRGEVIKIAPDGDIVIAGRLIGDDQVGSPVDFDVNGMASVNCGQSSITSVEIIHSFVARYDADFRLKWYETFRGYKIMDIGFLQDDDIIIVGSNFDGIYAKRQNIIRRYLPAGPGCWLASCEEKFGDLGFNDNTWTIETDPIGGIFISGQVNGAENLNGYPLGASTFKTSGFVANLDENCNFQWAFDITDDDPSIQPNGTTGIGGGIAHAIEIDYPSLFVIGNYTDNDLNLFDPTITTIPSPIVPDLNDGKGGTYIAHYDISSDPTTNTNSLQWVFGIATQSQDFHDIDLDGMGNLWITGHLTGSNVNFEPDKINQSPTIINGTNNDAPDIYIAKYTDLYDGNSLPELVAVTTRGGTTGDIAYGMEIQNGDVYIAGTTNKTPVSSFVESDIYVGKFECICDTESASEDCCDDLVVTQRSASPGDCCHVFDMENNTGFDVYKLEVELTNPDWIINNSQTALLNGFMVTNSSLNSICIEHSSGVLPKGVTTGFLSACLTDLFPGASDPQTLLFKWYERGLNNSEILSCVDTIDLACESPVEEEDCILLTELESVCSSNTSLEYELNFMATNTNLYPFDGSDILLQNLPPGFSFQLCSGGALEDPIKLIPTPQPLQTGQTSAPICVKIIANQPITVPTAVCFQAGLNKENGCCHSTQDYCVILEPCCSPCESIDLLSDPLAEGGDCCHSLDLINTCQYEYFNKVELDVLTTGVEFGAFVLNDLSNWNVTGASATAITVEPTNAFIAAGNYTDFFEFCLDDIEAGEFPQAVRVSFYTIASDGTDSVACTKDLIYQCPPSDNACLAISELEAQCVEGQNKYQLSFEVENLSNPSFTATHLSLVPQQGGVTIMPNPIPLPGLAPGDPPLSVSAMVMTNPYPDSDGILPLTFQLKYANGDSTCFENVIEEVALPDCSDCTCEGLSSLTVSVDGAVVDPAVNCGDELVLPDCGYNLAVGGLINCVPDTCSGSYSWTLTKVGGACVGNCTNITAGSAIQLGWDLSPDPMAPNASGPGIYELELSTNCGNVSCASCIIRFEVSCVMDTECCLQLDSLPPMVDAFNLPADVSNVNFYIEEDFIDVDNDGDYDLLTKIAQYSFGLGYYENIGSPTNPDFDFNNPKSIGVFAEKPYMYDYNQDGYQDFFAIIGGGDLYYFENQGLTGQVGFDPYYTGVTLTFAGQIAIGDLTNDGLPDLLIANSWAFPDLHVLFYEHLPMGNCSTASGQSPCFQLAGNSINHPFIELLLAVENFPSIELYDFDCDNDLDLYVNCFSDGGTSTESWVFENYSDGTLIPSGSTPNMETVQYEINPGGQVSETVCGEFFITRFVDIDNDLDADLFLDNGCNMFFMENTCVPVSTESVFNRQNLTLFPNPTNQRLNVRFEEVLEMNLKVQILDIWGRSLLQTQFDRGSSLFGLDVSSLPSALYLIQMIGEDGQQIQRKVVIQH